jgi:hypothetical protein
MLKLLLILILIQSAFAQKISIDERRKRILGIIDEELSEATRLAKQQEYRAPDTILRMSELYLEKARLWREVENEQYLSIPPEERRNLNKSSYFKQSAQYFQTANNSAKTLVEKFPKYKSIGEVYYILAYNYKELGDNQNAQKYFTLASQKAPSNSTVGSKSKLALADYYFNAHKYQQAIPLYEAGINKVDERWWTKDAFNLAWSYYRTKNYERAIALMKDVHKKSSNGKYIDMRSLVERDIGIFYVDAGKLDEAIRFYQGLGLNYNDQFVKIANSIMTQGRFSQAESLLKHAVDNEKDRTKKVDILLAQLSLFDKFSKVSEHLKASQELVSFHQQKALAADQLQPLIFQVNKKAAELQKAAASDIYQNVPKVRKQKAQQAISYFELSGILSPELRAEKIFFQGESAFVASNFSKALSFYLASFDLSKEKGDKKILSQSLEGMLSSLGQPSLPKSVADKNYIPVYTRYLAVDSKSNRASTIFVKLFNAQFDAGDIASAEKTMSDFAQSFPQDFKTQEGMLAKIMDHHREKKNYPAVKAYVAQINDGKYKVSKKYADALRNLMTKIQIEGVQQSLERGDKGVALKGYHQIYASSESTQKAKTNAAYNLGALYYELGDTNQSFQWAIKALSEMGQSDVIKFADSFLNIAAGYFLRQDFKRSADLTEQVLTKICKIDSSNKVIAFKNTVFIALANGDLEQAISVFDTAPNCLIPDVTVVEVGLELLKELAKDKRWEKYEILLQGLEKNSKNYPQLIKPIEDLRLQYLALGDVQKASDLENKQIAFYKQSKTQQLEIPVEGLDLIAEKMMKNVIAKKQRLLQIPLEFPEANFNNAVKTKLELLDQLTGEVNTIQKIGSGRGIVDAYRHVIESYENFGEDLKRFSPQGKSPEYVESFQKAMAEVYNPILANARKQRQEIKKLIAENKILSDSNILVLQASGEEVRRYYSSQAPVLMERAGKR